MGDQDQCHRSTKKTARPILTLGGERCEWTGQPIANYRVLNRFLKEEAERLAASEAAWERAQQRKLRVQNRRKLREELAAKREEKEQRLAERRRVTWIALVREAADIGLKPDPRWSEHEFKLEIWYKKQDIRREEEERAREEYWAEEQQRTAEQRLFWQRQQKEESARFLAKVWKRSVARSQELKRSADPEELGDLWKHIPHIVKFGIFDSDPDSWGFGREHRSISRINFPARNPQKQPRTWEAVAPRQWRRKDHCSGRWNHLFINDPAAE